jgi:uncharacterized protein (DUF342 family)
MVDIVRLQHSIKKKLERDRNIRLVEAEGTTLEAAVADAAALLRVPIRRLEYEVVERGAAGILGRGKKNWKIRAYERNDIVKAPEENALFVGAPVETAPEVADKDGELFVQVRPEGVFLKVIPPEGKGKRVSESAALAALAARQVAKFDQALTADTVKQAAAVYVRVGAVELAPGKNATAAVSITDQEMKAYITLNPPGPGGCDLMAESIIDFLRANGVVYGLREKELREFADRPQYRESFLAAEGIKPINGRDASLQYNFETEQSNVRLREGVDGKVDFKDLNIIQNVVEGQPLARKIAAETGVAGKTVTGKLVPAKSGRDISMPLGKNVHQSEDGCTIIADMNGQVLVAAGKINVEPIYTVQGNVDTKTGNIIFLGTVIINGNVDDGFSVKAAGNIEVNGIVEKAELDAEGDIIVHKGITGRSSGGIRAGRSLWARFIENAVVEAGSMVVVSDGIVNSQVDAARCIICQGKRAHIVGGRLRATEEINAKMIGSPTSGTETVCEVGFDPKGKAQLDKLLDEKAAAEKEKEEVLLNLQTLAAIKKQRKSLPEDKEAYMRELLERRKVLLETLEHIDGAIEKKQEFLSTVGSRSRVSASGKVYPGVKIVIRDIRENVRTEYKAATFLLEGGMVRVTKYEEPDEELTRGPDGYTAY